MLRPRARQRRGLEAGELGHDAEGGEVAQPARGDQVADRRLGIALQLLQERREQDHGRVLQHAHDQRDGDADSEVAVAERRRVEQRRARRHHVDGEHGEEQHRQARFVMVSGESNQSLRWPRSNSSWAAAIAMAMKTKPV